MLTIFTEIDSDDIKWW